MIPLGTKVFIARDRFPMYKSFDSLSLLVQDVLDMDPLSGYMFIFFNKRGNYMKALYWENNGFCIWQKRLEKGSFRVPSIMNTQWEVNFQELQMLISGIDMRYMPKPFNIEDYVVA